MKCHTIPIIYYKPWSTMDTINLERNKRKIYKFNKNEKEKILTSIKTIGINEIWEENYYILDIKNSYDRYIIQDEIMECLKNAPKELGIAGLTFIQLDEKLSKENWSTILEYLTTQLGEFNAPKDKSLAKSIEDFFSQGCEKKWIGLVNEINEFLISGKALKDESKDNLLEFVSIQYYRKKENILNQIKSIVSCIQPLVPVVNISNDEYAKSKFIDFLYEYKIYKENQELYITQKNKMPNIAKTKCFFKSLQLSFIESPRGQSFITSDSPVYIVDQNYMSSGIYMPISPKICLFLFKTSKIINGDFKILHATDGLVKYVNWLTLVNSANVIISNEGSISDKISEEFPENEFLDMMNQ